MKKFIPIFLFLALTLFSFAPLTAQAAMFPDVPDGFWAQKDIEEIAAKGIVAGKPDGRFDPNAHVTRGQFALMLYRALKLPEGRSSFRDVQNGTVLGKAVGAIVQAGIAQGYPDGTFRPNQPITRGQMAVMITRALGYEDEAIANKNASLPFKDRFVETQRGYIKVVSERGIIRGTSTNTFSAGKPTTRAQTAVIINRMLKHRPQADLSMAERLVYAAKGDIEKVRYYLEMGIDPNVRIADGSTALMHASSPEIIKLLLEHGANPNLKDHQGHTALSRWLESAIEFGNVNSEPIITLLQFGADPTLTPELSNQAVFAFVSPWHTDVLKLFIKKGVDVNTKQPDSLTTPLMFAAYNNYIDAAKVLLELGADPNLKDIEGRTALSIAEERGFDEFVKLLKQYGAR